MQDGRHTYWTLANTNKHHNPFSFTNFELIIILTVAESYSQLAQRAPLDQTFRGFVNMTVVVFIRCHLPHFGTSVYLVFYFHDKN